jgi:hypothetical protein
MKRDAHVSSLTADIRRADESESNLHGLSEIPSDDVLWATVPYTTPGLTRAALRHAASCADLDIHVSLVDIQVVPFPCPLDVPPIQKEHSVNRLLRLFEDTGVQGQAAVFYTRDWIEGFLRLLDRRSLIILAMNNSWWPGREKKLARALSQAGHQVMLATVRLCPTSRQRWPV